MKVKKQRSYSRVTIEAALLMGLYIQLARKERGWSEEDLADRAGISRITLRKIEKGELNISLGFAFEVATIVGVKLFDPGPSRFAIGSEQLKDKIALLPKRVRAPKKEVVNDDF